MARRSVDAPALIILALAVLLLPLRWIAAWLFAVTVHELAHYGAVHLFGGHVAGFTAGTSSARMEVVGLDSAGELWCALAGPIGSLMLIALIHIWPAAALCGAVQGLYNLLPLFPLDGGRVLRCIIVRLGGHPRIEMGIGIAVLFLLWLIAGYAAVCLKMGIIPILAVFVLQIKTNFGKIPCKRDAY